MELRTERVESAVILHLDGRLTIETGAEWLRDAGRAVRGQGVRHVLIDVGRNGVPVVNTVNQDVLRRYLLGAADAESMREIEQRLFSEDQVFWERVAIAEDELVDEHAAGALDGKEQALFDANFLVTAERRAKLESARAIRTYARQQERRPHFLTGWLRVPAARAAGVR